MNQSEIEREAERYLAEKNIIHCGYYGCRDSMIHMANWLQQQKEGEAIEFAEWCDKLPLVQRMTVHPPEGSGGAFGIYELTTKELFKKFQSTRSNKKEQ